MSTQKFHFAFLLGNRVTNQTYFSSEKQRKENLHFEGDSKKWISCGFAKHNRTTPPDYGKSACRSFGNDRQACKQIYLINLKNRKTNRLLAHTILRFLKGFTFQNTVKMSAGIGVARVVSASADDPEVVVVQEETDDE